MIKKIFSTSILFGIAAGLFLPARSFALQMPQNGNDLAGMADIQSPLYAVMDISSGEILIGKNQDTVWTPASLTKLVTALVVLDTKTKLNKTVPITAQDQTLGQCGNGGSCIKARPGARFSMDGLFHAALLPSANNAASALARGTGLSSTAFVARMNAKARSLGATHTHFVEPTGMSPDNLTTAADYAKILRAAFENNYLRNIAQLSAYYLRSTNLGRYSQLIKNTDKLLSNGDVDVIGAKTGYLNESRYNFASILRYHNGAEMAVVVLGEDHLYTAFSDTMALARLGRDAKELASSGYFQSN